MFKKQYGELVICIDSPATSWRKEKYPFYKYSRKKYQQQQTAIDWNQVYKDLNTVRDEIINNFPYKVIGIPGAEADDVIAVLSTIPGLHVIVSKDKDFSQLRSDTIHQYSHTKKRLLVEDDNMSLNEHIIRGDVGDGIPNVLSPNDTFMVGGRQKKISKIMLAAWDEQLQVKVDPTDWNADTILRYIENRELIDFNFIPDELKQKIFAAYNDYPINNRKKIFSYFLNNNLNKLINRIDEV